MRWIPLLAMLLLPALSAQGVETIHELQAEGWRLHSNNQSAEAYEAYRDAALIALRQGRPDLQARCMTNMANIVTFADDADLDKGARLARRVDEIATEIGRRDLRTTILFTLEFTAEDDEKPAILRRKFDLYLAEEYVGSLAWLVESHSGKEGWREIARNAVTAQDLSVDARLRARGMGAREAARELAKAADEVNALGFPIAATALLEDAVEHEPGIAAVLKPLYEASGNRRGQTMCAILLTDVEDRESAVADLEECFRTAEEMRDFDLQIKAAERLHEITGDTWWDRSIERIREAEKFELIASAERTFRNRWFHEFNLLPRLKKYAGDAEVDSWLDRLEARERFRESPELAAQFRKALADPKTLRAAVTIAEIGNRHEAFDVIVEALKSGKDNPIELAYGIETLAREDDCATLLKLLEHTNPHVQEAAGAALFRLGVNGIEAETRDAVNRLEEAESGGVKTPHRVYLLGALARLGDAASLEKVKEMAGRRDEVEYFAFADSVLASLGHLSPSLSLKADIANHSDSHHLLRAMGRMPKTWGQTDITMWKLGEGKYHAARIWGLRGSNVRRSFTDRTDPYALAWAMPNDHDDYKFWNGFGIHEHVAKIEDPVGRELIEWAAEYGGLCSNSLIAPPQTEPAREEDPEGDDENEGVPALRRMIELEKEYRNTPLGSNERRLILVDWAASNQYARCEVRGYNGLAEFEGMSKVRIPFQWNWQRQVWSGGLLGAMYREVILRLAEADLLHKIEIVIPGHPAVTGVYHGPSGDEQWGSITADLPIIIGEGLGDDRPLPLETLQQGKLRVTFNFNGNTGTMVFPLLTDVPPEAAKPDLTPTRITLDPAVPEIGQSSLIRVRVKNNGKSIDGNALSTIRFMVHNPQSEDGWHVLDAQVFSANGWRAGESRTFEVRPKFVESYYMNQFSYTYTPEIGDSKVAVWVDPDNSIEEADEDNNRLELETPLRRSGDEGVKLAEVEAAEALAGMTGDLANAKTIEELDAAYDRIVDVIDRLKVKTSAIRFFSQTLSRSYWFRRGKIRAAEALDKFESAQESGSLTQSDARAIRNSLMHSQREILRAGTPVEIETLEKSRNATLLAANTASAGSELEDLLYSQGVLPDNDSGLSEATQLLKGIDALKLIHIEAERMRRTGDLDTGNVLDVIGNTADAIGAKLPFMNAPVKAMLKGELEYTQTGFQKSTTAIERLTDVINGKEGSEEQLLQAVNGVEEHFTTAPFNEEDILVSTLKSIPVVKEIVDIIVSWK